MPQGSFPQPLPVDVMAAPALSWCLSLLIFLLSLDIPQVSTAMNAETSKLTCFYDSKANISCVWSQDGGLQNTPCQICAQSYQR
nr:PREDICTED: interleukin-2 receptor subunit beta-like [Rhinolophus sinicus]